MSKQPQQQQTHASNGQSQKTSLQVVGAGNRLISHEDIAKRAYELYARRGYQNGHHEEDWRRAEAELRQKST